MPETDAEIDAATAIDVIGWRYSFLYAMQYYHIPNTNEIIVWKDDWRPTADLNQAFQVVDAMRKDGFAFFLESADDDHDYIAQFARYETDSWYTGVDKSPARAICKAALAAKRGQNG